MADHSWQTGPKSSPATQLAPKDNSAPATGGGIPADQLDKDVEFFRTLLKFRTVSAEGPTNGEYRACVDWLAAHCAQLGLETQVVEAVAGKPVLVATLRGRDPSLPCVVLNSHYDVVPAMAEHWHAR